MISKKPLISTTLAIFVSIYLLTAIIAILDKKPLDSFIYGILETVVLIIGGSGIGFFAILALITFTRKKVTDSLYTVKSNKRFSVDKGELFTGRSYTKEEVNPETDFPTFLREWLDSKNNEDAYLQLFIEAAGILKAHRDLTFNTGIGIYANNCKIIETMLLLNNDLNPDLIILIGFTHNLGRVEVTEENNYSRIAAKSRNILANTDAAWQISTIRELLFIVSNYVNDSKRINQNSKDNELDSRQIIPYIELLNKAYNQQGVNFVAHSPQLKISDYEALDNNSRVSMVAHKVEQTDVDAYLELEPIIAREQVIIPTPKSKTKRISREPEQQRVANFESKQTDNKAIQQPASGNTKRDIGIKLDQLKI